MMDNTIMDLLYYQSAVYAFKQPISENASFAINC